MTVSALQPAGSSKSIVFESLAARFEDRFSTGAVLCAQHGHTLTWVQNQPPDAVLFPETTDEIADTVKLFAEARVPVIPFGTGTSLEGHVNAPFGGLCLDLSRMNRIVAVHEGDLDCVVEPGVTRKALNGHLRDLGLFFPVDPGADASLGGMAATRASGTNAVRYGTMRDNVLALTAVLADGRVIHTGTRARKSAAGYDLTRLLIGSEGTLGIVTQLTLKLHGVPETIVSAICPFASIEGACNATMTAMQMGGLGLARIELLDEVQIKACNAYSKLSLAETPTLFLEFHGSAATTREGVEVFAGIAHEEAGGDFQWAEAQEERNRLWQARHNAYWAARGLVPGAEIVSTDVCVPLSRLAACVTETRADIGASGLIAPIVGHVGDGNFHVMPLFDRDSAEDRRKVQGLLDRLAARALDMGGTCTGEHGIGQGKIAYLAAEHGAGVEVMVAIKKALDPLNILNPGKIFKLS
jgi:D-lactate dehydrogenase (cytochrome)